MIEALRHHGRSLLVASWLGAAILFAAVVAPGAFRVLPTSELAGRVVGHTLSWLNVSGVVMSLALLLARGRREDAVGSERLRRIESFALASMCLATGATEFVINKRIANLRSAHDIASLAKSDPARVEFGMLHGASVVVFGVGVAAAVVALLVIVRRDYRSI